MHVLRNFKIEDPDTFTHPASPAVARGARRLQGLQPWGVVVQQLAAVLALDVTLVRNALHHCARE